MFIRIWMNDITSVKLFCANYRKTLYNFVTFIKFTRDALSRDPRPTTVLWITYQGFLRVQYAQCDGHTPQCHWAGQSWWHASRCRYRDHGQPPVMLALLLALPAHNTTQEAKAFTEHSGNTHSRGNHYRATARAELVKCLLSIPLRAVTMDAGTSIALAIQEVLQGICTLFSLHEHQRKGIFSCTQKDSLWSLCHPRASHVHKHPKKINVQWQLKHDSFAIFDNH